MDRIELSTPDLTEENIQKLGELFPQVLTEVQDEAGEVRQAVDFDALRDLLGDVAEGQRERYQFTWPGKREAKAEARRPIDKTLRPCPEESVDWDTTENLYIEGDNLDALKILKETYAGKVKMIYIDPPYNTGHDIFPYPDYYAQDSSDYRLSSDDFDETCERMTTNVEAYGRFHSVWCSMVYQRLSLARDFLTDDGLVFISIGDAELHNLIAICHEVFGKANHVGTVPRISKRGSNKGTFFRPTKDYVLVFAKEIASCEAFSVITESNESNYPFLEDEGMARAGERYRKGHSLYQASLDSRPNQRYYIEAPDGTLLIPPGSVFPAEKRDASHVVPRSNSDKVWRWSYQSYLEHKEAGRIMFAKSKQSPLLDQDGESTCWNVYEKKYLLDDVDRETLPDDVIYGYLNSTATSALEALGIHFAFSKPIGLIEYLIDISMANEEITVLDFFSGSASCAHAVMDKNARDGLRRKFIMVQVPEACPGNSEAYVDGYRNICEIGKERIRRAGAKIKAEVEEANAQLKLGEESKKVPDIGFRVLKIESSNFKDTLATPDETTQQTLLDFQDNVKDGRSDMDLLFEALPKFRIPYSARIEELVICGKRCFNVEDGQLIACFDVNVDVDAIEAIAKMQPIYAVIRDASLTDDATHANFEELFKTYSPETVRRVI